MNLLLLNAATFLLTTLHVNQENFNKLLFFNDLNTNEIDCYFHEDLD